MKKRLNNNGASIILSLVYLLICSIISIIIITCASVSIGSNLCDINSKSFYLTTSLLKLVSDEFSNNSITVYKNKTTDETAHTLGETGLRCFGNVFSAALTDFISDNKTEKVHNLFIQIENTDITFLCDFMMDKDFCIIVRINHIYGPEEEYALAYNNAIMFKPLVKHETDAYVIINYGEGEVYAEKQQG